MTSPRLRLPWWSLLALAAACDRVPVQTALAEREANSVALLLEEAGLPARKEAEKGGAGRDRTWAVTVSGSDAGRALQVLQDHAMPRRTPAGFDAVLDEDSLIPTASEERVRHLHAQSGELARTLESVRGVIEARVHLGVPGTPEAGALDAAPAPPTASVLLRVATTAPPIAVADVQKLVAGGVPGLAPGAVNVVVVSQPPPTRPATDGLVSVVGIRVSPSSAGSMRVMMAASLGVIGLLAAGLVVSNLRRRQPRTAKSAP